MSAARPNTDSSTVSRVLAGTTLALRVAREATDSISIAKQILGSAAHISEFAEKIEKNRKAMNDLIAKSAEYARHIDTIVAGRIVEGKVLSILRRLFSVFTRIEALVAEAAAVKNGMKRRFHNIFTAPNKASELSSELEKEIQLFNLAMMLDMRLAISETAEETLRAIHENSLYDSDGFRRIRPADVRKLGELPDRWHERNNVTLAKARINGELMVIRHPRSSGPVPSDWATHLDTVKALSYPRTQHPNVVQLYGQSVGNPDNTFVAYRSGCHIFTDYVKHNRDKMSPQLRAVKAFEMVIKLVDASRHIEHMLDLVWLCEGFIGRNLAVDDEFNPTIGLFDDFDDDRNNIFSFDWVLSSWFPTKTDQSGTVHDFQLVRAIASESNVPHEILHILQQLQDMNVDAKCRSRSIPIDYPSTSLAPATVALSRAHFEWLVTPNVYSGLETTHTRALVLGSQQCESIWEFHYYCGRHSDYINLQRCWIENGSRRYEEGIFNLDDELAIEYRAILGYQDKEKARFIYRSDFGWLERPRQHQK